jgi:cytochrome c oxidase subunit 3
VIFYVFKIGEYLNASFSLADGIYGSTFYMTTRFSWFSCISWNYFSWGLLWKEFANLLQSIMLVLSLLFGIGILLNVVWLFVHLVIYWWGSL